MPQRQFFEHIQRFDLRDQDPFTTAAVDRTAHLAEWRRMDELMDQVDVHESPDHDTPKLIGNVAAKSSFDWDAYQGADFDASDTRYNFNWLSQ